ncbi:hypothetical protein BDFB_005754 [Asbolus verrucosus]|uniref:Uncharacterized protein n=1 Tax=Asbolus verrucosus TaxID=1661398 RepID=A0A482W207_ASBVE|nr:hypothetical protein BDFB_005754 [Asbolus verrucosus]
MANFLCCIAWFLVLWFVSFFVAGFCAWIYILLYPLSMCISALTVSFYLTSC